MKTITLNIVALNTLLGSALLLLCEWGFNIYNVNIS